MFTRLISSLIHIKKSTGHINNDSRMIIVRQVVLKFWVRLKDKMLCKTFVISKMRAPLHHAFLDRNTEHICHQHKKMSTFPSFQVENQ